MEFLPYAQVVRALEQHGVYEQASGGLVRFGLRPGAGKHAGSACVVEFSPGASALADGPAPLRCVAVPAEGLADKAEALVARAHLGEIALIPTSRWRGFLDLAAFELAEDEGWLEVDAEASLHQNGRDPLVLLPSSRHVVGTVARALFKVASSAEHDLTIVGMEAPIVIELRHDPRLRLICPSEGVAESILARL